MEERWRTMCRLEGDLQRLQPTGATPVAFRWRAEEVCGLLLSYGEGSDAGSTTLLQLTLLRRCAEAQAVDSTAEHAGDAATHRRVLAAVCERAWSTAGMNDLMARLASADGWVALAARRALQALLLAPPPGGVAEPSYRRALRSHYERLLSLPVALDRVDAPVATNKGVMVEVLKLITELMKAWRRRLEQGTDEANQRMPTPHHAVGRELLSCLLDHLSAQLVHCVTQSEHGLHVLCNLLVEAMKSAQVGRDIAPSEDEPNDAVASASESCFVSDAMIAEKILTLCPALVEYLKARVRVSRGDGMQACSPLLRLLTHLFDTGLSSSSPSLSKLAAFCIDVLNLLVTLECAAARDHRTSALRTEAQDSSSLALIRARLAPRFPMAIDRIRLLPASESAFLTDEMTPGQLEVIRRRMLLLLLRVCAACAQQFPPSSARPSSEEDTTSHASAIIASPPRPLEGPTTRKRKTTTEHPHKQPHNKHRRLTETSEAERALNASLAALLRTHMGTYVVLRGGEVIAAFFDLVSSQDNTMVEAMHHLLTIHQTVSQTPPLQAWLRDVAVGPEALSALLERLSPDAVFIGFLRAVGFDHLLLLDLLIGSETSFLAYLCQYLRHLAAHRHAFVATCRQIIADEEDDQDEDAEEEDDDDEEEAVERRDRGGNDEDGRGEVMAMEERVDDVLRSLHDTIERLDRKGLFPYRAKPLLALLRAATETPSGEDAT